MTDYELIDRVVKETCSYIVHSIKDEAYEWEVFDDEETGSSIFIDHSKELQDLIGNALKTLTFGIQKEVFKSLVYRLEGGGYAGCGDIRESVTDWCWSKHKRWDWSEEKAGQNTAEEDKIWWEQEKVRKKALAK